MSDMTNHIANIFNQGILNHAQLQKYHYLTTSLEHFNIVAVTLIVILILFLIFRLIKNKNKKDKTSIIVFAISSFLILLILFTNGVIELKQGDITDTVVNNTINKKEMTDFYKNYPLCIADKNKVVFVKNKNDFNKYKNQKIVVNSDNAPVMEAVYNKKTIKLKSVKDGKDFEFYVKKKNSQTTKGMFSILIKENIDSQIKK